MRRKKLSRKKSKKNFRAGNGVKTRNFGGTPMRGGIRL